jgi:hypothetical protein
MFAHKCHMLQALQEFFRTALVAVIEITNQTIEGAQLARSSMVRCVLDTLLGIHQGHTERPIFLEARDMITTISSTPLHLVSLETIACPLVPHRMMALMLTSTFSSCFESGEE